MREEDRVDRLALAALRAGWRAQGALASREALAPGLAPPALEPSRVATVLARTAHEQLDGLAALGLRALGADEAALDLSARLKTATLRSLLVESSRRKVTAALGARG